MTLAFSIPDSFWGRAVGLASIALVLSVILQISIYVYNIYFHPLSHIPGPRLWAASRIPHERAYVRGVLIHELAALHARYGDVVRVSPRGVSFIHPDAWPDIYARKPHQTPFVKDPRRYTKDLCINGAPEILTADKDDHSRLRRVLAPAFSDRAIHDQEPLIQANVDLLIRRLRETGAAGAVDMSQWLNWATFDIIGDLAFGEPFGCLAAGDYHPWVALIFDCVQAGSVIGAIKQFPVADALLQRLMPPALFQKLRDHQALAIAKVDRRLATVTERGDFLTSILRHADTDKELSRGEIYSNCSLLIMAGSETTASAMAGCVFFLARHPDVCALLRQELARTCASEKDISFDAVAAAAMPFLTAVLNESMRLYPAQPIFTPRKTPPGGAVVAGHFLPEKTTVGIYQWTAYHSPANFRNPHTFDPTRWLDNPLYDGDRKDVFRPFSTGPRNCIAKQLAYAEMRLVICRLVWNFDFELCEPRRDWTDQEVYWSWKRVALMVRLTERVVAVKE